MKYNYNKLVRDKIPEEINNMEGRNATFRIMEDEEYSKELNRKLLEECHEFIEENDSEELADVMVYCLHMADALNVDINEIINKKMDKNEKKYPVEKAKGNSKKYTEL